eukprot:TRINITY_DN5460_c0_g1_i2.p1 TRINITY_DN5460_c0_g1~~TRINITY_DN5460_c0_g1_i2.p1  ORF type:complete len:370 (-),score=47.69 TRINITY_DN5460_c0_g1_i2:1151-2260(-)
MAGNSWKYRIGLLLIGSVVLIWVAAAEVTQLIFSTYRHPFILTWLGAALLSVYLPIALIKDACTKCFSTSLPLTPQPQKSIPKSGSGHAAVLVSPRMSVLMTPSLRSPVASNGDVELIQTSFGSETELFGENGSEERMLLGGEDVGGKERRGGTTQQLTALELTKTAFILAPLWLLTEYTSNASLSLTSVATTTILSSTSGLFTLTFGVLCGQDAFTVPKVVAVFVCIAGVIMTELGKTPSDEDMLSSLGPSAAGNPSQPGHSLWGDALGLASAASYGFYTTMLKKYAGDEDSGDSKTDMQKLFGAIGLVTLFTLWWLGLCRSCGPLPWLPLWAFPSPFRSPCSPTCSSMGSRTPGSTYWARYRSSPAS